MTKQETKFCVGDVVEIKSDALTRAAAHSQISEAKLRTLRLKVSKIDDSGQLTLAAPNQKSFTLHPKFVIPKANATVAA